MYASSKAALNMLTIRYAVTHFRMTMVCLESTTRRRFFQSAYYEEGRWLRPAELAGFPVSSPQRKLMTELANPSRQKRLF